MSTIEEKYILKIIDELKDCEMAVMLESGEGKRPVRIDNDVVEPLEFMKYSDSLEMLEGGKVWTPDLWFWIRTLNSDFGRTFWIGDPDD